MTRTRPINFLAGAALVPLVALAVAGCGGDDDSGSAAAVVTPPKTSSGKAATIGVAQTELGKFLVDSRGHTVYLFEGDQKAGDTNGQGLNAFGALWYVESPAGSAVTTQSSSSGGGGGY